MWPEVIRGCFTNMDSKVGSQERVGIDISEAERGTFQVRGRYEQHLDLGRRLKGKCGKILSLAKGLT